MAIYYSTQAADQSKYNDYTDASKRLGGTVMTSPMQIDYTLTGSEVADDLIILGILPDGVTIDTANSYLYTPGGATTLTFDIGDYDLPSNDGTDWDNLTEATDANNVDRYADGINGASAGVVLFTSGTAPLELTAPTPTTQTGLLVAKVVSAATVGTDKLNFNIAYKKIPHG